MHEVYCHTSPSGKRYVGWTSRTTARRWLQHLADVRRGSQTAFHRAIRKYGPEAFGHELLERMTTEAGAKRAEQLWIARLGTQDSGHGYNETAGGDGVLGHVQSAATRAAKAEAGRGRTHSAETRAKLSAKARGRRASIATRAKMAAAQRGRRHSEETLAKMRAAQRKRGARGPMSDETRAKMSAAQKRRYGRA